MKIEHLFVCPYCGSEVGYEPTEQCCSEVHGEWQYIDENGEQRTEQEYEEQDKETES